MVRELRNTRPSLIYSPLALAVWHSEGTAHPFKPIDRRHAANLHESVLKIRVKASRGSPRVRGCADSFTAASFSSAASFLSDEDALPGSAGKAMALGASEIITAIEKHQ